MIVSMIVLISCSVHDNEDGKTNENFGVIKKISLILEYGRDSVERPCCQSVLQTKKGGTIIVCVVSEVDITVTVW